MNGKVMPAYEAMATEEQNNLNENKENNAKQQDQTGPVFGSIDLWNRQRQAKLATRFVRRWEMN